jgi:hypothetical protein
MSDTPRTDEEAGHYDDSGCWRWRKNGETVPTEFAQQLERELAKSTEELNDIKYAIKAAQQPHSDEVHCSCCALLRAELTMIKEDK